MTGITELFDQDPGQIVISRSGNSLSTVVDEETVLLNTDTGTYNCLNPVGSAIWRHLQEPVSYDVLLGKLLDEYQVSETTCAGDLRTLLEQLHAEHLVEIAILPQQGTIAAWQQNEKADSGCE